MLCCLSLAPAGLDAAVPNYIARIWQADDGLSHSSVTAVIQSRDGYLWMGTRGGLVRFDGVRFTAFDNGNAPELQSPHITSLFEDDDGVLWIGHESGGVTCYQAGKFRAVTVPAALASGKIYAIGADQAGDIWLLNNIGELARLRDGLVIPAPVRRTTYVIAMVRNSNGGLWVQRDNEVSVLEDGHLKPLLFDQSATDRYIQGIGASRDGGLWVMTESRMRKWKDGRWVEDLGTAPWEWAVAHTVIETRDGHLAVATSDHGLYLISPGERSVQYSRATGFSDDWVTSLCEDREGNVWAGTGNGGLAMLRSANITAHSPPDQWQGHAVLSVAADPDGALWVGTEGAGLYRLHNGSWTNFDASSGLVHSYIWSVAFDVRGRTWAGTWGGSLFLQNAGRFEVPMELQDFSAPICGWKHHQPCVRADSTKLLSMAQKRNQRTEHLWHKYGDRRQ